MGSHGLRELCNNLEDGGTIYTAAKEKIDEHFKGAKNLTTERYKFFCIFHQYAHISHRHQVKKTKQKKKILQIGFCLSFYIF